MQSIDALRLEVAGKVDADISLNGREAEVQKKKKRVTSAEYIEVLTQQLGYTFGMLDLDDTLLINGQPANDGLEALIRTQMRDLGYPHVNVIRDAYIAHAYQCRKNPIKDYLTNQVRWDGEERIDKLAAHFTEPAGTDPVFKTWLKKWMVGAVAKVLKGYQNPMLVLVSRMRYTGNELKRAQGKGKSFFAQWLCSGLSDYFIASEINPHDKDYKKRQLTHFIWEVDELGSTTKKADVDALKSFITIPIVQTRPAYGRNDIRKKPMASFIGTVNYDGVGFLPDTTGNRRFLTAEIMDINWSYTKYDVDQLWGEAAVLYFKGYDYSLSSNEMALQDDGNQQFELDSAVDDVILKHFEITHDMADVTQTLDILTKMDFENIKDTTRVLEMAIAKSLTKRGLSKKQRPSRWFGIRAKR